MDVKQQCLWKSIGAGALGGLAASFAMNQFQSLSNKAWSKAKKAVSGQKSAGQESSGGDDATVKTAQAIADAVCGCQLSDSDKKWAGPAVHYTIGTAMGALYGAATQTVSAASSGRGVAFGTALWLGADEIAVPALGLTGSPTESPLSSHANALASHLVFGFVTDLVRRTMLRENA